MKMKYLRVKFSNGETYDIPAEFIARKRAEYYVEKDYEQKLFISEHRETEIKQEIIFAMQNENELFDWAFNNMDWMDVRDVAIRVSSSASVNYGREWGSNTESKIVTK